MKIIFLCLVPCKKKFKKYISSFNYKQPKLKILTNLNWNSQILIKNTTMNQTQTQIGSKNPDLLDNNNK